MSDRGKDDGADPLEPVNRDEEMPEAVEPPANVVEGQAEANRGQAANIGEVYPPVKAEGPGSPVLAAGAGGAPNVPILPPQNQIPINLNNNNHDNEQERERVPNNMRFLRMQRRPWAEMVEEDQDNKEHEFEFLEIQGPAPQRHHPFREHYGAQPDLEPKISVAKRLAAETTLEDVQSFRNYTAGEIHRPALHEDKPPNTMVELSLNFITKLPSEPHALATIVENNGTVYKVAMVFKEVVANDRPDLMYMNFTKWSYDVTSRKYAELKQYYKGDTIMIHKVVKRRDVAPESFMKTFDQIRNMKAHNYWQVSEFSLVQRKISEPQPFSLVGRAAGGRHSKKLAVCGVTEIVTVSEDTFNDNRAPQGYRADAVAFTPVLIPGQLLKSLLPGTPHIVVRRETAAQSKSWDLRPQVINFGIMGARKAYPFLHLPNYMAGRSPNTEDAWRGVRKLGHHGLSAMISTSNMNQDKFHYETTLQHVRELEGSMKVSFALQYPGRPVKACNWKNGTKFSIETPAGTFVPAAVDHAVQSTDAITTIECRILRPADNAVHILAVGEDAVLIKQTKEADGHLLAATPVVPVDTVLDRNKGLATFAALNGGPIIASNGLNYPHKEFRYQNFVCSAQQSTFIQACCDLKLGALSLDGAFGTGKTKAVAATAIEFSNQNIQRVIISANNNGAVKAIHDAIRSLAPRGRVKVVRAMSARLRDEAKPEVLTEDDFPILWREVFTEVVQSVNRPNVRGTHPAIIDAARHLNAHGLLPSPMLNNEIRVRCKAPYKTEPPAHTIWTALMKIHETAIIIGTTASIHTALNDIGFASKANEIGLVMLDEASQIPMIKIGGLATHFPKAKFVLVGD
ncbi:DNA2/NAM7 helicase helicase domain-containing protein [Caenorhabditis elegans]|uniref:DNA2/NAM7 helicase helicase domain-containing protein n=1 Tax=Caenorhabditis elegans TaxID=6239 RepID=O01978_CAEEL|nr:DNA2/NAM7 helicase helicase domain-containing protein [Caenorhabditis elegans]CCD64255.1 DNA2/NAM7 helicase helicase domain-containing protein [Caenorhabditis elegans]|eukprot:NP_491376.1 Uncharacterized protein CELE_C41D11.6 [Caenorhabditis elegans]